MSSTGTLEAGTVVGDRYRIEESLGGEGSGAAYRATDLRLERAVGLRALAPSEGAQHGKAAARLVHPNVARVLDFGADAALGMEFVVADLGTGGSLAALLAQRGTPPLPLATRIVQEAAAGMAAAHRAGLVHGDLHPGVLWLSRDEGRLRVQVLGLGLTPAGAPPSRPTARYAAPERLRRARELSPAADVFSLGVVAFEVFAGLPAEWTSLLLSMARGQAAIAPSLRDARPELPAHVVQAVRRALLADAAQRWPDAGELAAHLIAESAAAPAHPAPAVVADTSAPVVVSTPAKAAPAAAAGPVAARVAAPAEPGPIAEPAVAAMAGEPAPVAAETAVEATAPARTSRPAPRRAKPIAAAKTDLADSLYIPPPLAKPAPPARAESTADAPAPPASVTPPAPAPERTPVPAQAAAPPVLSAPEPAAPAEETLAAPVLAPVVALVPAAPAPHPVAPEPVEVGVIELGGRRRSGGLAKLGQSSGGQRRGLLAASIAVAVVVGGGVIARTVLAGADATAPGAQALAAAALAPGAAAQGTAQPQQAPAEAAAPAAAPVPADETPEERVRRLEEERKLEEQRRQQRQRDSLRNAQQLAAQQQLPAPQQVALAAAPGPAASAPAPQIEQRAPAAATAPAETAAPPPAARPRVDPSRVYGGGEVDQPPSLANGSAFRSAVNRTYPATLRNSGQWGNALVSFTVGADGRVERSSISVDQVSHPAFRAAATAAISSARFTPARVDGQPVRAQVSMPITWQAGGREED